MPPIEDPSLEVELDTDLRGSYKLGFMFAVPIEIRKLKLFNINSVFQ